MNIRAEPVGSSSPDQYRRSSIPVIYIPNPFSTWQSSKHRRPSTTNNTLTGRFLRAFFFKNYLGWRGQTISMKISSGAQSENLEPSLTIKEFFSKKNSLYAAYVYPFWVVSLSPRKAFASVGPIRMLEGTE